MIRTKSVFSPIDKKRDGLRLLVTRYRGRYMLTSRYDVWMPNLAPSERLLKQMQTGRMTWSSFAKSYRAEIFEGGSFDGRNATIKNHGQKFTLRLLKSLSTKGPVTLLCHCAEDQTQCHRHILAKIIGSKKV